MKELMYQGQVVGVFSTSEEAKKYADKMGYGTYSIYPSGTFLATDIKEKL